MAILAPFRAPQPKGCYRFPATVANTGAFVGWSVPGNNGAGFVSTVYYSSRFGVGAFHGTPAVPPVPINGTFVIPARWGLLRGAMAYQVPSGP